MRPGNRTLDYAGRQGRGRIRLEQTPHGIRIRFPASSRKAAGDTFGFFANLAEFGCLFMIALFGLGSLLVYWIVRGDFASARNWYLVGGWLALVGLTILIFRICLLRRTEIHLTADTLTVRIGLTAEKWAAPRSEVTGINTEDGRPRIWLTGSRLLAAGRESEALYWHEPMPDDELEWLVETLREHLRLP